MFEKTLLMDTIDSNDLGLVKKLLEEHPEELNKVNDRGYTSLMFAIYRHKNHAIVEYLVKKGADLNIQDKEGNTVLMYVFFCCKDSYLYTIVKLLIDYEANIHLKNNNGSHIFNYFMPLDVFKLLIKRKNIYYINFETIFTTADRLKVYVEYSNQINSEIIELYKLI